MSYVFIEEDFMKKVLILSTIILSVGLAMVLISSILQGVNWGGTFDGTAFSNALNDIGYIVSMLSGVVVTGAGVSFAIKSGYSEKDKSDEK